MVSRQGPPTSEFAEPRSHIERRLRLVVLGMAVFSSLWCLFFASAGIGELIDNKNGAPQMRLPSLVPTSPRQPDNFPQLTSLAIAQTVMYTIALLFQVFGIAVVATQRAKYIELYTYLFPLAVVLATTVGFLRMLIHFTFKNDLIAECEVIVQGDGSDFPFGFWGLHLPSHLNATDSAASYCNNLWNSNSWTEIVITIVVFLIGLMSTSVIIVYQAIRPTSPPAHRRTKSA